MRNVFLSGVQRVGKGLSKAKVASHQARKKCKRFDDNGNQNPKNLLREMIEVSDDTVKMDSSPVSSQVGRRSRMSTASSCSAMLSEAVLSQRIVSVESYMAPPAKEFDNTYSDFRCGAVKRVPIIRIFGTTPAGKL